MRALIPVLFPLLLAACSAPASRHEAASVHGPVVYSCEDGLTLRVRFARDGAHVNLPSGEEVFLPKQPAGASGSYGTAQHELTVPGEQATWRSGRGVPVGCRVRR